MGVAHPSLYLYYAELRLKGSIPRKKKGPTVGP